MLKLTKDRVIWARRRRVLRVIPALAAAAITVREQRADAREEIQPHQISATIEEDGIGKQNVSESVRVSRIFQSGSVEIEAQIDGDGSPFVILPSYGRDAGKDFDDISKRLVTAGWMVVRPQPRGIGKSSGAMAGVTLHDLADDVALVLRSLGRGPAVVLGHAYGNLVTRVLATDHPELVKAAVLAAAQASRVAPDVAATPFIAGDTSAPEATRLKALRRAFFAPDHDPHIWLSGWYPETLRMQHIAAQATSQNTYWACGSVPILEIIAEYDPFKPKESWKDLHEQLGDRVTTRVVSDAAHALFPEQPDAVSDSLLPWTKGYL
ncbi:alpha/beta fold hydrolase [Paraburkholderia sp. RL18-085-BIA-A]|uniref:alpha/beta fold hydrolase n=1 Tax=Paraburkholderia sp. RL18-085-BIA-A TaxID=3031633 RepID=UPI0038B8D773